MAHAKKGALHQVLVPMVDATDFASVESAITASDFNSGATVKYYGWDTGGSAATTSGAPSKVASLVHSGVFRITLKGTENNFDYMMLRVSKTGCAEQILQWENVNNDDSDIVSYLTALSGAVSDAHSAAAQANSRILVVQSHASQIDSLLSSLNSEFLSRVPKAVATNSQLSDLASDLKSAIGNVSVTLAASDISQIASEVVTAIGVSGPVSDIYSLLSDLNSQFLSRVPKAVATNSQLSDVLSDLRSVMSSAGPTVSDLASAVIVELGGDMSDIRSAIATVTASVSASDMSDIASRVRALLDSDLSDILSRTTQINSRVILIQSRLSDFNSTVNSDLSDLLSRTTQINSRVALVQSNVSDIESQVDAGVPLNASDMSDIRSAITAVGVSASSISDIVSAIRASAEANPLHVNIHEVNDVSLVGDGDGTPWGPA